MTERVASVYHNETGECPKGSPGDGMSAAELPRVRTIAICDEAISSEIEAEVHMLENVRLRIVVDSLPHSRWLCVYLVLSHYREGTFAGEIHLVRESSNRMTRFKKFTVEFTPGTDRIAMYVEMGECRFPAAGNYTFEVWFLDEAAVAVQKGDERLEVHTTEAES